MVDGSVVAEGDSPKDVESLDGSEVHSMGTLHERKAPASMVVSNTPKPRTSTARSPRWIDVQRSLGRRDKQSSMRIAGMGALPLERPASLPAYSSYVVPRLESAKCDPALSRYSSAQFRHTY